MSLMTPKTLMDRELELEEEMLHAGYTRFWKGVTEAKQNERESTVGAYTKIMKYAINPMAIAVTNWIKEVKSGKAGPKACAVKYFELFEPEVLAYFTIKACFDGMSKKKLMQRVAVTIGTMLEDEFNMDVFEGTEKKLYKKLQDFKKGTSNYAHKRVAFRKAMNKFNVAGGYQSWPEADKLHVGTKLIDLLIESTGMFEAQRQTERSKDTIYKVMATPKTLDWIEKENIKLELLSPVLLPMIVPPKPWTNPSDGGYYNEKLKTFQLVKTRNKNFLEELTNLVDDMPIIYKCVNTLQATPWSINPKVFEVMKHFWELGEAIAGLPTRDELPIRPCPIPEGKTKEELDPEEARNFIEWKHEASRVYTERNSIKSKRTQIHTTIALAERYLNDKLYFPYNYDFRGRLYALPAFLNPQSTDFSKGLLQFAEGKAISNPTAGDWLGIHGANLWGYDKVSLTARTDWAVDFTEEAIRIAQDPYSNLKWTEADKPWQFLAWCFEWAQFEEEGLSFVSHLPIALDGSCNGLQHFSAMLRDPVGGSAVNLIPQDNPADIYQEVADRVMQKLADLRETDEDEEVRNLARQCHHFGIDRKVTKRPVMVVPYGGTFTSCRDYIHDALWERFENGVNPFSVTPFQAATFLAKLTQEAISETVIAARSAMSWLQSIARVVSKSEAPINWQTPSGFWVQQAYEDYNARRIKTHLNGEVIQLTIKEAKNKLDKNRQVNGISPNFVHSMDASALHLYVVKAAEELGIQAFSMIHDSYATLAADTEAAAQCLRDVFVDMYQGNDVLNDFHSFCSGLTDSELPLVPKSGELDLEVVRKSPFFFA